MAGQQHVPRADTPAVVSVDRDEQYEKEYTHAMKKLEARKRCQRCPGL